MAARQPASAPPAAQARKHRGDFATPPELVAQVVEHTLPAVRPGQVVRVLDPACGDGRFLVAAAARLAAAGAVPVLTGIDVDADAVAATRVALRAGGWAGAVERADALERTWTGPAFDIVVGNPPYLSQLAAATARGRASRHGGGPYADTAAEFVALAVRLARPGGGRIGLVLPQSILASRDAGPVRADVERLATRVWAWWSPRLHFDAQVLVCALAFERRAEPVEVAGEPAWSDVVTAALGIPGLPALAGAGTLGQRVRLTANFRDQYYGLVPAVGDHEAGPPLVTSGLIDPGCCRWGERPVTFAGRRFRQPRVELARLAPVMRRWASGMTTPKVVIANQTRVIEAVADMGGEWLPGVPLLTARPHDAGDVATVAAVEAVLTSPVAAAWAWHRAAGTGLSARVLRLGPRWLAELPWPAGSLAPAVRALAAGDVDACGAAVTAAYGHAAGTPAAGVLQEWWRTQLPGSGAGHALTGPGAVPSVVGRGCQTAAP